MGNPPVALHYPIIIRLEPVEGEPIYGEEMFVARCEYFCPASTILARQVTRPHFFGCFVRLAPNSKRVIKA